MKRVSVVVGANYGDEGKGLITDFLSTPLTLVVRSNGGAQAAHTVVTPEGRRHVFKHHGSGSFHGAQTFLSKFFVCNPIVFMQEREKLSVLDIRKKIYVDPDSQITTPYDMLLNQAFERSRGDGRHGSCGLGFFETLKRSEKLPFSCYELWKPALLVEKLRNIQEHAIERARLAGLPAIKAMYEEKIFIKFIDDLYSFAACTEMAVWMEAAKEYDDIVFEGAQGLRLHRNSADFPHVTPSDTGLSNALAMCEEASLTDISAYYVTRTYESRHGAGPIPHVHELPFRGIRDDTNIENDHQGKMRFGYLSRDRMINDIRQDFYQHKGRGIRGHLAVTCADQLDGPMITYYSHGRRHTRSLFAFVQEAVADLGFNGALVSKGRSRTDVVKYNFPIDLTV